MIDLAAYAEACDTLHRWLNVHEDRFIDITISTDILDETPAGKKITARRWEITVFPEDDLNNNEVVSVEADSFEDAVKKLGEALNG